MALILDTRIRALDSSGNPLVGATLTIYNAGTTTLSSVYRDSARLTPMTNPTSGSDVSDSGGWFPQIFCAEGGSYDITLKNSGGSTIKAYVNVPALGADTGTLTRDLTNSRWRIRNVGGVVYEEFGNAAGDDAGGSGRIGGWAGTQMDDYTIDAAAVTFTGTSGLGAGKHAIWVPAAAMIARTTNGPSSGLAETTTNKVMRQTLDFDKDTIEYAQFQLRMPKSWNESTVTAVFEWTHGSTTTNFKVSWGLQGVGLSDADALDAAFGTAQYANDTGGSTDTMYASPETAAITLAGSPAPEDLVVFQVLRKADDATNDTLAVDARLHGITLYVTTNALSDD